MVRRRIDPNRKFCVMLSFIILNEKIKVINLSRELKSNFNLKYSTANTYASRYLSELSNLNVLRRENSEYVLTPKGWYLIYEFFEEIGYPEYFSIDVLLERLRKEDNVASLLMPALKIIIEVRKDLKGEKERKDLEEEDLYELFEEYIEYREIMGDEKLPENWEDILDLIIPPIEEHPLNIFLNLLKEKLRNKNELTKAAVKDLLKKKAELLKKEATDLRRESEELENKAQEIINKIEKEIK